MRPLTDTANLILELVRRSLDVGDAEGTLYQLELLVERVSSIVSQPRSLLRFSLPSGLQWRHCQCETHPDTYATVGHSGNHIAFHGCGGMRRFAVSSMRRHRTCSSRSRGSRHSVGCKRRTMTYVRLRSNHERWCNAYRPIYRPIYRPQHVARLSAYDLRPTIRSVTGPVSE